MERVIERCAGLDIHKKTVTVCVRAPGACGDGPRVAPGLPRSAAWRAASGALLSLGGVTPCTMLSGIYAACLTG